MEVTDVGALLAPFCDPWSDWRPSIDPPTPPPPRPSHESYAPPSPSPSVGAPSSPCTPPPPPPPPRQETPPPPLWPPSPPPQTPFATKKVEEERDSDGVLRMVCAVCGERVSVPAMHAHMEKVHPAPHKCDHCDKRFTSPTSRERHAAHAHVRRDRLRSYPCPVADCGQVFSGTSYVSIHVLTKHAEYTAELLYACNPCQVVFPTDHARRMHYKTNRHVRIVQNEQQPPAFQCEWCPTRRYVYFHALQLHHIEKHVLQDTDVPAPRRSLLHNVTAPTQMSD
jgi:hypothetical protein